MLNIEDSLEKFKTENGKNEFNEVLETDYVSYLIMYYSHVEDDLITKLYSIYMTEPDPDQFAALKQRLVAHIPPEEHEYLDLTHAFINESSKDCPVEMNGGESYDPFVDTENSVHIIDMIQAYSTMSDDTEE